MASSILRSIVALAILVGLPSLALCQTLRDDGRTDQQLRSATLDSYELVSPISSYTETFYLRTNGDGSAPETIAGAFDAADFNTAGNWDTDDQDDGKIGPNDRVMVLDDDGAITTELDVKGSGLAGKPITIAGEPGGAATISGVTNGIDVTSKSYLHIDNLSMTNVTHGVYLYAGGGNFSDVTISNCPSIQPSSASGSACVYANTGTGNHWSGIKIQTNGCTPYSTGTQHYGVTFLKNVDSFDIDGNIISGAGEDGIVVDTCGSATRSYIRNNTLGGNGENSIDVKDTRDVTVSTNACSNDGQANIVVHDDSTPTNLTYNIIVESNSLALGGQSAVPRAGVYLQYADDCVVRYNSVTTSNAHGIWLEDKENSSNDNQIYYNLIFSNGTGNFGAGISLSDAVNPHVFNNTIYNQGTTGHGIYVYGNTNTTDVQLKNNVIHTAAGDLIRFNSGAITNADVDYNLYYPDGSSQFTWNGTASDNFADWKSDSSQDAHGVTSDPLFTNAAGGDFTLQSASPACNAGADVSLTRDFIGTTVPDAATPEIGAYEKVGCAGP